MKHDNIRTKVDIFAKDAKRKHQKHIDVGKHQKKRHEIRFFEKFSPRFVGKIREIRGVAAFLNLNVTEEHIRQLGKFTTMIAPGSQFL